MKIWKTFKTLRRLSPRKQTKKQLRRRKSMLTWICLKTETLVIPLSLLKVIFSEILISQVKNATWKVLKFQVTPLRQNKHHKVIVLTRETTLYPQLKSFQRMKNKIATSVTKLSQVSSLNRVHSVLKIQFSSHVQTISKVWLRK